MLSRVSICNTFSANWAFRLKPLCVASDPSPDGFRLSQQVPWESRRARCFVPIPCGPLLWYFRHLAFPAFFSPLSVFFSNVSLNLDVLLAYGEYALGCRSHGSSLLQTPDYRQARSSHLRIFPLAKTNPHWHGQPPCWFSRAVVSIKEVVSMGSTGIPWKVAAFSTKIFRLRKLF